MIEAVGSSFLNTSIGAGSAVTPNAVGSVNPNNKMSEGQAAGADFGQLLTQLSGEAVQTLKSAEQVSVAAIGSKVSAQQAVDSILAAERTLQTTIAVRDKLVSAYQEISRISI